MNLEKLGIPTALIITPEFLGSLELHAKVFGAPEYTPVILDIPTSSIAGAIPERVEQYAEDVVDEVIAVLSGR